MIIVVRRLSMLAVLLATLVLTVPSPAGAAAMPPGNLNWTIIQGTCGGQPAQLLDPRGGNTAFLVGGSVLVGKIFTAIDNDTGQVLDQTITGRGIDPARLITCVFLFPDITIPGLGTIDLRFEVQVAADPTRRLTRIPGPITGDSQRHLVRPSTSHTIDFKRGESARCYQLVCGDRCWSCCSRP